MASTDHLSEEFASHSQPTPNSGERVMMPPARSVHNKMPGKISPAERGQRTSSKNARSAWEATDVGKARTSGFSPEIASQATPAQIHMINNQDNPEPKGPRVYDRQLPGMSDPDQAPRPPKWEELSAENQAHAIRGLAKQGTNIETMISDIGNQLDQASERAMRATDASGTNTRPYAEDFYEKGEPRQKVDSSAAELGIPRALHAQLNAFTSPNTKFSITSDEGVTKFPNDDAARHAAIHVQKGGKPEDITNDTADTIKLDKPATSKSKSEYGAVQGYTSNLKKAAVAMQRHENGLNPDPDAFKGAPKTGPYANSWGDVHPQFTVADVHTGGGGAFPHLGSDKPTKKGADGEVVLNKKGAPVREKSRREAAIEQTPFAHSAIDFAHRSAMKERGMGHVRESQAAQWGEEQLQRGESGMAGGPKHDEVYPTNPKVPKKPEDDNQGTLF